MSATESIDEIQKSILDEIEFLTPRERYDYIIEQGLNLKPFRPEEKRPELLVPGCVSQVWLESSFQDGVLKFRADSDSIFVKGMVALLIRMYSGQTPDSILKSNLNFLVESGLMQTLSATRSNGVASMMRRILKDATEAKNAHLLKSSQKKT